jgi:hypothetical protein
MIFVLAATVIVVVALMVVFVLVRHQATAGTSGTARTSSSGSVPPGAQAAVQLLLSPHGRSAVTPELNAVLPAGKLFPAGTTFTPIPGSWHEVGAYANVTGILRQPGRGPRKAEIGLVHRRGRWLVTFEVTV